MPALALTTPEPDEPDGLRALTDAELKAQLADSLRLTVSNLRRSAYLLREAEQRNLDLSDVPMMGLVHHLRKIACGQMLPEVVVQLGGKYSLISRVGNLSLDDQRRIAVNGDHLLLVVSERDGNRTTRMAPPVGMTASQLDQVFARDHIRTETEQHLYLDAKTEQARRAEKQSVGPMEISPDRRGVHVGKTWISTDELRCALRILNA